MAKSQALSPSPGLHRLLLIVLINGLVTFSQQGVVSAAKEDLDGLGLAYSNGIDGDLQAAGSDLSGDDTPYVPENNLANLCQLLYGPRNFGKRNFNPWGGKRTPTHSIFGFSPECEYYRQISEFGKRGTAFNPWGGKRSNSADVDGRTSRVTKNEKSRSAFNPWGGK